MNNLTRHTWESMGKPRLVWYHFQLVLAIQSKVLSISQLTQVPIEIGLKTYAEFEVIDIVDDTNPYPTLMGIDYEIDNQTTINFKKWILKFEDSKLRVVAPIDPLEGQRYIKKVNSEGKGGNHDDIYKITSIMDDYVNPTTYINLIWRNVSSYTSYSGEALEN